MPLRYGINPHQTPARVFSHGRLPFQVLNGAPGYINLLDALNSWQLVRELRETLGMPAAASFKHVSPAGAAIGLPLSDALRQAYFVGSADLSPLAMAYARARGADRVCSYGDWVALSDKVDLETARLLRREVSDGVIAPAFEPAALDLLKAKRGGRYTVLQIDPAYEPAELETRQVFGISFEQKRNAVIPGDDLLDNVVTRRREIPDDARRDMLLALITLKYTQSNSVCLVADGQVIGNGAGQQSRIHCTRLAAAKADTWYLRQHPDVLGLPFPQRPRPRRPRQRDRPVPARRSHPGRRGSLARGVFRRAPAALGRCKTRLAEPPQRRHPGLRCVHPVSGQRRSRPRERRRVHRRARRRDALGRHRRRLRRVRHGDGAYGPAAVPPLTFRRPLRFARSGAVSGDR